MCLSEISKAASELTRDIAQKFNRDLTVKTCQFLCQLLIGIFQNHVSKDGNQKMSKSDQSSYHA